MSYSDDLERRREARKARIEREEFVSRATRRISDNPEALRILHGLEDDRLMGEIMGRRAELAVLNLRFYECGRESPEESHRQYGADFPQRSTRFIYFEVEMTNPHWGVGDRQHNIVTRYYRPDGSVLCQMQNDFVLKAEWKTGKFFNGYSAGEGRWPVGTYLVEISIDGANFTQGQFTISGASEGSTTTGFSPRLHVPIEDIGSEIVKMITSIQVDPTVSPEDKEALTLLWETAGIAKLIERLKGESPRNSAKIRDLQQKEKRLQQTYDEVNRTILQGMREVVRKGKRQRKEK